MATLHKGFVINHIAICTCNSLKCWFKHPLPTHKVVYSNIFVCCVFFCLSIFERQEDILRSIIINLRKAIDGESMV
jgi:hypothetical protein